MPEGVCVYSHFLQSIGVCQGSMSKYIAPMISQAMMLYTPTSVLPAFLTNNANEENVQQVSWTNKKKGVIVKPASYILLFKPWVRICAI